MPRKLRFLFLLVSLASSTAFAQTQVGANCLIYEKSGLKGAFWATKAEDTGPSKMTDWWQNRASSVWVEKGYALELYADNDFSGAVSYVHGGPQISGPDREAGTSIDLAKLQFQGKLSSFKCRYVGERLSSYPDIFYFFQPLPVFYADLSWTEIIAGDPRVLTAKLVFDEGDIKLKVRVTTRSAPDRAGYAYSLNLRTAAIHVHYERSGLGDAGDKTYVYDKVLEYAFGKDNIEYRGALVGMAIAAQKIAKGYDYGSGYSMPASLELQAIADELNRILEVQ